MTNTELTLDQLTSIAGGVTEGPDGRGCTDRWIPKSLMDIFGKKGSKDSSLAQETGVYSPPGQDGNEGPTVNH